MVRSAQPNPITAPTSESLVAQFLIIKVGISIMDKVVDRIRIMSDNELVDFIYQIQQCTVNDFANFIEPTPDSIEKLLQTELMGNEVKFNDYVLHID